MSIALVQTTLSAAISANQTTFSVASATGISAPSGGFMQKIYVIPLNGTKGELMTVTAVNGTAISVSRLDMFKSSHPTGSIVLVASIDPTIDGFKEYNPTGAPATDPGLATPWVNVLTGEQWIWSSISLQWVPGWNNPSSVKGPTAAVASAAGVILPSGPLFHVTGALAITGFTIPVGFAGGSFTIIPDAAFTWTAAGNIALAGTAVIGKALTFTYDSGDAKVFTPSYIA